MPRQAGQRLVDGVDLSRLIHRHRVRHQHAAQFGGRVLDLEPFDVLVADAQNLERPLGLAVADGRGQIADRLAEPVRRRQPRDADVVVPAEAVDQIREHRTRVDRRQLIGIADQQQSGLRSHRLQQPRHHGQRHHGRLVDDDHVVRQAVSAVVPEPRRVLRLPPQQPVHGGGAQPRNALAINGFQLVDLRLHGLVQPRSGLAGGCGQRDAQRRLARGLSLAGQQRQQSCDGRGLARARTAGQHGEALPQCQFGCGALLVVAGREQSLHVGGRRFPGVGDHRQQILGDLLLLAPVAVEVQQPVTHAQHVGGDQRARLDRGQPLCGPGQFRQIDLRGDRVEVDAHRPAAQSAHRERDGERHPFVLVTRECGQPLRDEHIRSLDDTRLVERVQQSRRACGQPPVRGIQDVRHAALPASSRSDISTIRAAGGCQSRTPAG